MGKCFSKDQSKGSGGNKVFQQNKAISQVIATEQGRKAVLGCAVKVAGGAPSGGESKAKLEEDGRVGLGEGKQDLLIPPVVVEKKNVADLEPVVEAEVFQEVEQTVEEEVSSPVDALEVVSDGVGKQGAVVQEMFPVSSIEIGQIQPDSGLLSGDQQSRLRRPSMSSTEFASHFGDDEVLPQIFPLGVAKDDSRLGGPAAQKLASSAETKTTKDATFMKPSAIVSSPATTTQEVKLTKSGRLALKDISINVHPKREPAHKRQFSISPAMQSFDGFQETIYRDQSPKPLPSDFKRSRSSKRSMDWTALTEDVGAVNDGVKTDKGVCSASTAQQTNISITLNVDLVDSASKRHSSVHVRHEETVPSDCHKSVQATVSSSPTIANAANATGSIVASAAATLRNDGWLISSLLTDQDKGAELPSDNLGCLEFTSLDSISPSIEDPPAPLKKEVGEREEESGDLEDVTAVVNNVQIIVPTSDSPSGVLDQSRSDSTPSSELNETNDVSGSMFSREIGAGGMILKVSDAEGMASTENDCATMASSTVPNHYPDTGFLAVADDVAPNPTPDVTAERASDLSDKSLDSAEDESTVAQMIAVEGEHRIEDDLDGRSQEGTSTERCGPVIVVYHESFEAQVSRPVIQEQAYSEYPEKENQVLIFQTDREVGTEEGEHAAEDSSEVAPVAEVAEVLMDGWQQTNASLLPIEISVDSNHPASGELDVQDVVLNGTPVQSVRIDISNGESSPDNDTDGSDETQDVKLTGGHLPSDILDGEWNPHNNNSGSHEAQDVNLTGATIPRDILVGETNLDNNNGGCNESLDAISNGNPVQIGIVNGGPHPDNNCDRDETQDVPLNGTPVQNDTSNIDAIPDNNCGRNETQDVIQNDILVPRGTSNGDSNPDHNAGRDETQDVILDVSRLHSDASNGDSDADNHHKYEIHLTSSAGEVATIGDVVIVTCQPAEVTGTSDFEGKIAVEVTSDIFSNQDSNEAVRVGDQGAKPFEESAGGLSHAVGNRLEQATLAPQPAGSISPEDSSDHVTPATKIATQDATEGETNTSGDAPMSWTTSEELLVSSVSSKARSDAFGSPFKSVMSEFELSSEHNEEQLGNFSSEKPDQKSEHTSQQELNVNAELPISSLPVISPLETRDTTVSGPPQVKQNPAESVGLPNKSSTQPLSDNFLVKVPAGSKRSLPFIPRPPRPVKTTESQLPDALPSFNDRPLRLSTSAPSSPQGPIIDLSLYSLPSTPGDSCARRSSVDSRGSEGPILDLSQFSLPSTPLSMSARSTPASNPSTPKRIGHANAIALTADEIAEIWGAFELRSLTSSPAAV